MSTLNNSIEGYYPSGNLATIDNTKTAGASMVKIGVIAGLVLVVLASITIPATLGVVASNAGTEAVEQALAGASEPIPISQLINIEEAARTGSVAYKCMIAALVVFSPVYLCLFVAGAIVKRLSLK
jgi:hypothetical protein